VVLLAADLLAWTQTLLLTNHPDLTRAEPKTLRYRVLHTAARITRGQRQIWLRTQHNWPWAPSLVDAFHRLATLAVPQT
jgi:Transposase DDE domain group 1